jgi:FtsH-binding integral membrane protein
MSGPTPTPETIYNGPPIIPKDPPIVEASSADMAQVEADLRRFLLHTVIGIIGALLLSAFFADFADKKHEELSSFTIFPQLIWLMVGALFLGAGVISRTIERFTGSVAIATLIAYASAQGLIFGFIYRSMYGRSLGPMYLAIAVSFGILWIYGTRSGEDVSCTKSLLIGGAGAAITAFAASFFFGFPILDAIVVFVGSSLMLSLLCYHRDFIRDLPESFEDDWRWNKAAAIGALLIYLDVVIIVVVIIQARWLGELDNREERQLH